MVDVSGVGGQLSISQVTGGLDLEAFMMTVQAQRANNLEAQMADQIKDVKARQEQIAGMNDLLNRLRGSRPEEGRTALIGPDMKKELEAAGVAIQSSDPGKPGYVQDDKGEWSSLRDYLKNLKPDKQGWANLGGTLASSTRIVERLEAAGVTIKRDGKDSEFGGVNVPGTNVYDAKSGWIDQWVKDLDAKVAASGEGTFSMPQKTFDTLVDGLKAKIDNLNSTSQLDMIRLQSLSNKRNEAFEQLTSAIQKMAKVRDSIIGNSR